VKKTITLFSALRRANLSGALVSMIIAGLTLGILTFFSLRTQVDANLHLIARTIAYSTEAALMFNDKITTREILQQTLQRENLISATMTTPTGEVFAQVEQPQTKACGALCQSISRMIFPADTTVPVINAGQTLGTVTIRGQGTVFIDFFRNTAGAILLSLFLTGFATLQITRGAERTIISQLDRLAKNTLMRHALRSQEETSLQIAEFQQINAQFRNLLAELDVKNAELVARQMKLEDDNASLNYQASHDELTGLYNRAYFNECLTLAISNARKNKGKLALLYLDSDHFKSINDQHGHAVGDMYLIKTVQSIQQAVRRSDIVARLGGDEFVVLLAPLEDPGIAQRVAEKILKASEITILNEGRELKFTLSLSIGISIFSEMEEHDEDSLLLAADHAMYKAKKAGGRCYHMAPVIRNHT
jgi:diguanylate cyclase (GGDEF)-like protein